MGELVADRPVLILLERLPADQVGADGLLEVGRRGGADGARWLGPRGVADLGLGQGPGCEGVHEEQGGGQ